MKLFEEAKQSALFLKIDDRLDNLSCQPQSATLESQRRFSVVDSPTRTLAISEPAKGAGSKIGSNVSKVSKRRRLEIQAELMDQKLLIEIEKRERELELKEFCRGMERDLEELEKKQEMGRRKVEMQKRLQELQAESEIVEMKRKKGFEKHQLRLQLEEAEGSIRASSICPSLMSLTLEEDKNSDIKSWLDQGVEDFDICFSQPKESSREVENKGESSKPSQKFQSIYNQKNLQSRVQSRGLSKSPQRKEVVFSMPNPNMLPQQIKQDSKPKFQFSKPSSKAENDFPSFTPAIPVQQPVNLVQTSLQY